ncbi:hypothetical protein CPC16_002434 [Podila verticillata]|nr:hypothetical protein CPC16_002434 [Podila verticillata]
MPVQHPYPTAERICRAHVPYKGSSLLYLPRIQQDLLDVSNSYTTRIAIIDILAKESQRVLAIQKAAMQLVSDEIAGMGVIVLTDVSGYASRI